MKTRKVQIFVVALFIFLITYLVYLPGPGSFLHGLTSNSMFFDALEWLSLFFLIATVILLFFNDTIVKRWFKYIAIWFLPLSFVFSIVGAGSGLLQPSTDDLSILTGQMLVGITLIFALYNRFYRKTGVSN